MSYQEKYKKDLHKIQHSQTRQHSFLRCHCIAWYPRSQPDREGTAGSWLPCCDNKVYWVATNRYDLSAEEIATVYNLRWNIEIFFGWWKRHLKVYHLIARSKHGLMAQILGGLITYLLLAIYCHEHYQEKVSIKRVRELRIKIQNETHNLENDPPTPPCQQAGVHNLKEQKWRSYAIT